MLKHHDQKQLRKWFIWLTGYSPSKEKPKQELGNKTLGTGTKAETVEEYCLLVYSPYLSKPPYIMQDHLPQDGTTHSWALTSSIHFLTGQSDGNIFLS